MSKSRLFPNGCPDRVVKLLQDGGWRLVRMKKHYVYRREGGGVVVLPASPSDKRTWKNIISDITS
nr:HicA toxin protein-like protein [Oceanusvirus sp.]